MNKKVSFSLVGIASIVLGVICFFFDVGRYANLESYGGDAYTGIQNAAARAANNIQLLSIIVKCGFGFLLIITGLILIAIAVTKNTNNAQIVPAYSKVNETKNPNVAENKENPSEDIEEMDEIDYVGTIREYQKMVENGEMPEEEMKKRISRL